MKDSLRYPPHSLGEQGERLGEAYLKKSGYQILERNYRTKIGQIDLVAFKNKTIYFVEVKSRSQTRFGRPEESVTFAKQKKLIRLAQWYLKDKKREGVSASFGVLSILFETPDHPNITWIENAFEVPERFSSL